MPLSHSCRFGADRRTALRLCLALDHLHRVGFVHADLKPENVIVTPDDKPILCDFGLSRRGGAGPDPTGVSGTLFAIAPEVLLGNPVFVGQQNRI